MSNSSSGRIFDRYSGRDKQPKAPGMPANDAGRYLHEVERADAGNKLPYQAVHVDKSKVQSRLRLDYGDGKVVRILSYAYLIEVMSSSHQRLSLIFSNDIVTLKGRNLGALLDPFQDERVRTITCFHRGRYQQPDAGEPIIEEIVQDNIAELRKPKPENKPNM